MTSENSYSVIRMAVRGSFLHERVASSRWQFGTVCRVLCRTLLLHLRTKRKTALCVAETC